MSEPLISTRTSPEPRASMALGREPAAEEGSVIIGGSAGGATFTSDQVRQLADELLKAGAGREQVEAALKADGIAPKVVDGRTDEQIEMERAFGGAAAHDYRIDYRTRMPAGMADRDLAAADQEARAWLSDLALPVDLGPSVIEQAIDASQRYARMDDAERELWRREQQALFDRVAGSSERAIELLANVSRLRERGDADYWALLENAGALHDAEVLLHLGLHGERLRYFRATSR